MKSLFISTYRELIEIAYLNNGKLIDKKEQISNKNHSIYTMPLLKELLKDNNLDIHEFNEIIVIDGPGSFTGVRLGITVAKTLAYTLNIPIKCISSIEALAVSYDSPNKIITINDPKGKYFGVFINNNLEIMSYLSNKEYEEYKEKNYPNIDEIIINEIDVEKVYAFSKNIESTNPHMVKARYIKGIDALK